MTGCCGNCCGSEKSPVSASIVPEHERGCTDVLFLLAFILHWFVIIAIFSLAQDKGGNPDRIIHGTDFLGRICGSDSGVEHLPYAAWPYPPEYRFRVCVSDCSQTNNPAQPNMTYHYESITFVFWCVPALGLISNGSFVVDISLSGGFEDASDELSRAIGDVFTAWVMVLLSAFIALILSFLYTELVERAARCMVWTAILLIFVATFYIGTVLIEKAKDYGDTQVDDRAKVLNGIGWFLVGSAIIFLIVVIAMRDRIRIGIAVVKLAAMSLQDMASLVFWPLLPVLFAMVFMVWWVSVSLWIFSVWIEGSEPVPDTVRYARTSSSFGLLDTSKDFFPGVQTYTVYEWNDEMKEASAAHFFHLLWVGQALIYFSYFVSAGAICDWYFTAWESEGVKKRGEGPMELTHKPVKASARRACRFHLGTIALGALIIAIVNFIRACVYYLEQKSKVENPNFLQSCMFKCIHCCLWCAECCLDKISKNAFIWTCIWGDSFGTAACSSFSLLWRNLAKVAAINLIGSYLVMLGKVMVAFTTMAIAAGVFTTNSKYKEEISNIALPCLVCFAVAFIVASIFMTVFETSIDVVFFCFLVDEEHNKGHMLAPRALREAVGDFKGESEAQAKRTYSMRGLAIDGQPQPQQPRAQGGIQSHHY